MYSLGLNIGHNATAALAKDGKIMFCASEERFTKIKNHWGVPYKAIEFVLKDSKITMSRIDKVVVNARTANGHLHLKKALLGGIVNTYRAVPPENMWNRTKYKVPLSASTAMVAVSAIKKMSTKKLKEENRKLLAKALKISREKIVFLDHHTGHAMTCCYSLYNIPCDEKWLIFTLDGEGDDICASVNIWKDKKLKRIAETPYYKSLGKFYEAVTEFLGMKSFEHEYKVMGLAPYAKQNYAKKVYGKMKEIMWLKQTNPLVFDSKFQMNLAIFWLRENMRTIRFDNVAAGAQMLVEELTAEWVRHAAKKYKISNVALAGGVFMNVKANKKIMELPEVEKFYVFPSCADESLAISNALYGCELFYIENNKELIITPIKDLYLGPAYSNGVIEKYLRKKGYTKKYLVEWHPDINSKIAELLANNEIVARCTGRMEFGARALGNRSILCNPSNYDNIRVLNEMIKDRDFWMPFTPSIIKERENEYIINPKQVAAPYMILTFDTTPKAQKDIIAAVHPYDFTARPQILEREWNPDYYGVLKVFENLTGIGGVLNTSFNLHGLPIAMTPADAMRVFENSSLKYLAMGNWMVSKSKK